VYFLLDDRDSAVGGATQRIACKYVLDSGGGIHCHSKFVDSELGREISITDVSGGGSVAYHRPAPQLYDCNGEKFLFGEEKENCSSEHIKENIASLSHLIGSGYGVSKFIENLISPTDQNIPITRTEDGLFTFELYESCAETQYPALMATVAKHLGSRREREKRDRALLEKHEQLGHQTRLPRRIKCVVCLRAKGRRKQLPKHHYQKYRRKHVCHVDLAGPLPPNYGKYRYFMVFVQTGGFQEVRFLERKSDAWKHLAWYKHRHRKTRLIVSDNGGEFTGLRWKKALAEEDLDPEFVSPYHPELNSLAENGVKRVSTNTRALLLGAPHIPTKLWYLAADYGNRIDMRLPKQSLEGKNAFSVRYKQEPDLRNYRKFGEKILYRLRPEDRVSKFDEVFSPGYFVGLRDEMGEGREDMLVLTQDFARVVRSSEIKIEDCVLGNIPEIPADGSGEDAEQYVYHNKPLRSRGSYLCGFLDAPVVAWFANFLFQFLALFLCISTVKQPVLYTKPDDSFKVFMNSHKRTLPQRHEWKHFKKRLKTSPFWKRDSMQRVKNYLLKKRIVPDHPTGLLHTAELVDFLSDPEGGQAVDEHFVYAAKVKITPSLFEDPGWLAALEKEFLAFKNKDAFEPVKYLPEGKRAIPMVLLAELKENHRKKVRAIVLGDRQERSAEEYNYAPVCNWTTVRTLLQRTIDFNHSLCLADISEAFLYGDIDSEDIYVLPPKEFRRFHPEARWWRLKKSVYGLRSAPLSWNKKYVEEIKRLGWTQSELDPCVFHRGKSTHILYVDDILFSGEKEQILKDREEILTVFPGRKDDVQEDGSFKFLGCNCIFTPGKQVKVSNPQQIEKLLSFQAEGDDKTAKTPLLPEDKANLDDVLDKEIYRSVVGLVNYISQHTRPDLAYVTNYLSRELEDPSTLRLAQAKRALRYIRGTQEKELILERTKGFDAANPASIIRAVKCFSDADFAAVGANTGNLIALNGRPLWWKSTKQRLVSQSTCEAEYIALASAVKELTYFSGLLADIYKFELQGEIEEVYEIRIKPPEPYRVLCDNQAAIALAGNSFPSQRTKHLKIRYNYIREAVSSGLCNIEYVNTHANKADQFTKICSRALLDALFEGEN
jgi:hypothetical protein